MLGQAACLETIVVMERLRNGVLHFGEQHRLVKSRLGFQAYLITLFSIVAPGLKYLKLA